MVGLERQVTEEDNNVELLNHHYHGKKYYYSSCSCSIICTIGDSNKLTFGLRPCLLYSPHYYLIQILVFDVYV